MCIKKIPHIFSYFVFYSLLALLLIFNELQNILLYIFSNIKFFFSRKHFIDLFFCRFATLMNTLIIFISA